MNRTVPIFNLLFTGNFFDKGNASGSNLSSINTDAFYWQADDATAQFFRSADAAVYPSTNGIQCFMPFNIDSTPAKPILPLPEKMIFYLRAPNAIPMLYSGLQFDKKRLVAEVLSSPQKQYQLRGANVSCKNIGKQALVKQDDLLSIIFPLISQDVIYSLPIRSIANDVEIEAPNVVVNTKTYSTNNQQDLLQLQVVLAALLYKKVNITIIRKFKSQSVNDVLDVYVVPEHTPPDALAIVVIKPSDLELNLTNLSDYATKNHLVLHFPAPAAKLKLNVTTKDFSGGDKLVFNNQNVTGTAVSAHPSLIGFKLVKATINYGPFFLNQPQSLALVKGNRQAMARINPFLNYNYNNQTSVADVSISLTN